MVMDVMDRISREEATILEMEARRTFTARLAQEMSCVVDMRDGKDSWVGTTVLELNYVCYMSYIALPQPPRPP